MGRSVLFIPLTWNYKTEIMKKTLKKITLIAAFALPIAIVQHSAYVGKLLAQNEQRVFPSPFDNGKCVETCQHSKNICLIKTYNNEGTHIGTYQFPIKLLKVNWHNSELLELIYKDAAPAKDSFFYSMVTTRGEYIRGVLALNTSENLVVFIAEDSLVIRPLFKNYRVIKKIQKELWSTRGIHSSIKDVSFAAQDKVKLTYVAGSTKNTKTEVVEIFDDLRKKNKYRDTYPLMTLVKSIKSSSFLKEKNPPRYSYHPINLYDENLKTAWFEGVAGNGVGESVEFEFFVPITISSIAIHNGYSKSDNLFYKNGRVKTLEIAADKRRHTIDLKDVRKKQDFIINYKDIQTLKLTIKDVYAGSKYNDTGMSEILLSSTISPSYYLPMSDEKLKKVIIFHDSRVDYNSKENSDFNQISQLQMHTFLIHDFGGLDGCGNDDRLFSLTQTIIKNKYLIPPLLKSIYEKRRAYFFTESAESGYAEAIKQIWGNRLESLPLLAKFGTEDYTILYLRLILGDTRVLPDYLGFIIENGIWHEACCDKMPRTLLVESQDRYTRRYLQKALKNKKWMPDEVRSELEKALTQMKK